MEFTAADKEIMSKLVGQLTEETIERMNKNLEFFLHPKISLFIPSCGQCKYAVTPNHTHPSYTFIYYFQSVNDFIVEGKHISYDLSDGKCLSAMSPGIPHQEVAEDHFQSYIAILVETELFNKTMTQYIDTIPVFRGEAFLPNSELLCLLRCFMLETSKTGYRNPELLNSLTISITHLIVRSVISAAQEVFPLYDRLEIDRAIAYMNNHFGEKISAADIADQIHFSAGYFSKTFKSITGETPTDFLKHLRLQKACNMLISREESITEIALKCGFQSLSYFSTCFLESYRISPSDYRQGVLKIR